jgi:putative FmdB family regulatory protein
MPIYEYEPDDGNCDKCGGRFEMLQGIHDAPLTVCPQCGKPCHRVFSAFSTITDETNRLSQKNLERHGFTRYERTGDGTYEKTCGKGPKTLGGEN